MEHILRCYGDIYDIEIVKAQGSKLYDSQGRQYIDFEAGVWCTSLGHGHPRVNKVMHEQIDRVMHLGYRYRHSVVEEAAQAVLKINQMANGKAVFLSSGSEAVEFGVQAMRRISEKPLLLGLQGTYLSAFGSAGKRGSQEWYDFDWSKCRACEQECLTTCPRLKEIPMDKVAGMVFETGSGWVKSPPEKVVRTLAEMTAAHQGLVLANEITTGFGRTGAWFGYEHYDLKPDIVAMGKGMGNGYPVSAVAMSADVAMRIEKSGMRYAQSHQNDALACAVGSEVIRVIREENLVGRSARVGSYFKEQLEDLASRQSCIKEVRGRGLMLALEFESEQAQLLPRVHKELFDKGSLVGYSPAANMFRFFPALIIEEESIKSLVAALDHILSSLQIRS